MKFIFCSSSALICWSQLERKPIVCSKCQCTTNKPGFPPHLEFPTQNQHINKFTQNATKQKENITKYYRNTKKYITLGISNSKIQKIQTKTLKIPKTNKTPPNTNKYTDISAPEANLVSQITPNFQLTAKMLTNILKTLANTIKCHCDTNKPGF